MSNVPPRGTASRSSLSEIGEALRAHQRFAILSHVRPDGDAIGSQLGLALALRALGKEVQVWNEDGLLDKFRFLPGSEMVTRPPADARACEVVVALDTATRERLGSTLQAISEARLWINIDHHPSNPGYGDLVYIDDVAPATGQILYELIRAADLPLNREIAENLFVAISTDTGSFQYANTTTRTFEIAAELVRCGIDVGRISQLLYDSYPRRRAELLRTLLNNMRFEANARVASFSLSLAAAAALGVKPEDNEGLIDHLRAIEGVVVAAFFEELPQGKVRVSMRSKSNAADVCAICAQFGGGGHKLAAGARVAGTLAEVETMVLDSICHVINSNNA